MLKGERLSNLSEVAEDPNTVWKLTTIANWYGSGERMVEITSETAVWYSTGLFAVPITLGFGARSAKRVQDPGPPVYRP